ncbi:hypothetical protein PR048_017786 [Dryococelus australis]|uniref:Uncharacterized protein n=1 Tax=Dryococelus australis TaxID=614101 RepID=A0ABQ9HAN9_9NEOP|nr:hypothetical protein PR048_017786 [Dryococelus australis]
MESPEKTRRPAASSGMIPICKNPEVTRPGIEPEAVVAQRLERSPSTKGNRAQFPAASLWNFLNWESCRTIQLICRLSRGSPVSTRSCIPALLYVQLVSLTSALKTSLSMPSSVVSCRRFLMGFLLKSIYERSLCARTSTPGDHRRSSVTTLRAVVGSGCQWHTGASFGSSHRCELWLVGATNGTLARGRGACRGWWGLPFTHGVDLGLEAEVRVVVAPARPQRRCAHASPHQSLTVLRQAAVGLAEVVVGVEVRRVGPEALGEGGSARPQLLVQRGAVSLLTPEAGLAPQQQSAICTPQRAPRPVYVHRLPGGVGTAGAGSKPPPAAVAAVQVPGVYPAISSDSVSPQVLAPHTCNTHTHTALHIPYTVSALCRRLLADIETHYGEGYLRMDTMQRYILDAMARHSLLRDDTYKSSRLADVVWKAFPIWRRWATYNDTTPAKKQALNPVRLVRSKTGYTHGVAANDQKAETRKYTVQWRVSHRSLKMKSPCLNIVLCCREQQLGSQSHHNGLQVGWTLMNSSEISARLRTSWQLLLLAAAALCSFTGRMPFSEPIKSHAGRNSNISLGTVNSQQQSLVRGRGDVTGSGIKRMSRPSSSSDTNPIDRMLFSEGEAVKRLDEVETPGARALLGYLDGSNNEILRAIEGAMR